MHPCSHAPMRFFPDTPVRLISPSPFHRFTACPELSRRVSFRRNDLPPRVSVSPCLRVKRFFSPSPMLPFSHALPRPLALSPTRFFPVSPFHRFPVSLSGSSMPISSSSRSTSSSHPRLAAGFAGLGCVTFPTFTSVPASDAKHRS